MTLYTITRRIEIDAGHRIHLHGSKCRHLHGHRYVIDATCAARELHAQGEQTGMVLDFGFLKEEMLRVIDAPCDHGFLAAIDDVALLTLLAPEGVAPAEWIERLRAEVARQGWCATTANSLATKLYVLPAPPTAEVLARHWFERLAPAVHARSGGLAELAELIVHETPNCSARYRP
ncbi:MAG: 6-carboxytetrahydropterin synthase [Xanthomonadaceae bacterium]|nr:6-carboxytetrahydropterin synthase [Xanthomonadaceae bacterium]